jgi:hypothetical protein
MTGEDYEAVWVYMNLCVAAVRVICTLPRHLPERSGKKRYAPGGFESPTRGLDDKRHLALYGARSRQAAQPRTLADAWPLACDRLVQLRESVDVGLNRQLEADGGDAAAEFEDVDCG